MTKKYRLYHAYDCHSDIGFNNGYYLEGTFEDEDKARAFAESFFSPNMGDWDNCDPDSYMVITGHYDENGMPVEPKDFNADKHSYSYEYITITEIQL